MISDMEYDDLTQAHEETLKSVDFLRARVAELEDECNDRHDLLVEHRTRTTALQARVNELESENKRLRQQLLGTITQEAQRMGLYGGSDGQRTVDSKSGDSFQSKRRR